MTGPRAHGKCGTHAVPFTLCHFYPPPSKECVFVSLDSRFSMDWLGLASICAHHGAEVTASPKINSRGYIFFGFFFFYLCSATATRIIFLHQPVGPRGGDLDTWPRVPAHTSLEQSPLAEWQITYVPSQAQVKSDTLQTHEL